MSKNNVVKLAGRDTIIDPLTELLRSGAEQLIYQAVEAELLELLAEHVERRTEDGKTGVVRNGHLPARKLQNRIGAGHGQDPQNTSEDRRAGDVPISSGAAVCTQDEVTGSGAAVALPEGDFQWRDGGSPESAGGSGCNRLVGRQGIASEAGLGRRISELMRGTPG